MARSGTCRSRRCRRPIAPLPDRRGARRVRAVAHLPLREARAHADARRSIGRPASRSNCSPSAIPRWRRPKPRRFRRCRTRRIKSAASRPSIPRNAARRSSAPPRARRASSAMRAGIASCTSPRTACWTTATRSTPRCCSPVTRVTRTATAEDGRLEARELMDIPLAADLVVLSACETARGRIGAGEGVLGLSGPSSSPAARAPSSANGRSGTRARRA